MPPRRKRERAALPVSLPDSRVSEWKTGDCAACLLNLFDDEEEMEGVSVIETCNHVFHPSCLIKWSSRDTSCPLCRLHFFYAATYGRNGSRMGDVRELKPVTFAETLTSEEEEEGETAEERAEESEVATEADLVAQAADRLRARLRRQQELRRRGRNAVPVGQAKRAIERYFRRLPFNPELPNQCKAATVPVKFIVEKAASTNNFNNFRKAKPAEN